MQQEEIKQLYNLLKKLQVNTYFGRRFEEIPDHPITISGPTFIGDLREKTSLNVVLDLVLDLLPNEEALKLI